MLFQSPLAKQWDYVVRELEGVIWKQKQLYAGAQNSLGYKVPVGTSPGWLIVLESALEKARVRRQRFRFAYRASLASSERELLLTYLQKIQHDLQCEIQVRGTQPHMADSALNENVLNLLNEWVMDVESTLEETPRRKRS